MQYETIILELLTRIKQLEDDVNFLKRQNTYFAEREENNSSQEERPKKTDSVSYKKMTAEMIEICYNYGKLAHEGENIQELAKKIVDEADMNKNSAIMYLYAVVGMLEGTVFKRAISSKAMQMYFNKILEEYGKNGLKRAIKAVRLHIDYRKDNGLTVESIEKICDENEKKL